MAQAHRFKRLFENAEKEVDAIAIFNGDHIDPNFFYISGYRNGIFERSAVFLFPDRHVEVLTNPLEEGAAKEKDYTVHIEKVFDASERKRMLSTILKGRNRIGVNFDGLSHKYFLGLEALLSSKELVDVSGAIAATRLLKDPDELEAMGKAAQVISKVVDEVPETAEEGMTEKALKAEIDYRMVEEGATSPSFESIVAFGSSSALPHYSAGERPLRKGDNLLVDVGARFDLYCSDITRTFFFGRASTKQKEVYEKVLEAQTESIAALREGVTGKSVHEVAKRIIDGSKFKGRFTHGLGHSLGLEVHDGAGIGARDSHKLKTNMVVTVEPGIYLTGEGGVRIEDDAVVTRSSCRLLTTSSRDLVEI